MKSKFILSLLIICAAFFAGNCGAKTDSLQTAENRISKPPLTKFEADLNYARTANMHYILVFRRRDGKIFDRDEISYLKKNSPVQTNQWLGGDEYVLAVSNFEFLKENYEALLKHYKIENFSDTEEGTSGVLITEVPPDAKTAVELEKIANGEMPLTNANVKANANAKANKQKP